MKWRMFWVLLLFAQVSKSQTWAELFEQKKTQKKYLVEQIEALQLYLGYAKKGYEIANDGLRTIGAIKNGDFTLHDGFFMSLSTVNPKIQKWAKVADIISLQISILQNARQTVKAARDDGHLSAEELNYCSSVFDDLLEDCILSIDALTMLVTSKEWNMKDDERMNRIAVLYLDMQDKYAFASSFGEGLARLVSSRKIDGAEIEQSKIINSIK
jgi:hypothetical protein